jgi:hypothetical protein
MKTTLEKLSRASRWRIRTGRWGTNDTAGWNGHFLLPADGEMWLTTLSDSSHWRRATICNAAKSLTPGWNVIRQIKDAFFSDDARVVIYLSAAADEFTLDLWENIDGLVPPPPK